MMKNIILGIFFIMVTQAQVSETKAVDFIKSKLQFRKYVSGPAQFDLMAFTNPSVAPTLLECLQIGRRREDNNPVRYFIIEKLGEFKYKPAKKTLLAVIDDKEDPWWVKSVALKALLQIGYHNITFYLNMLEVENIMIQKRAMIALQTITKKNKYITMASSLERVKIMRKNWQNLGRKYKKKRQSKKGKK
ncbi:HEAT repeat domain-containing protein [Candidatus Uabimicrobium sp. HlEnr_7]|uniref:HEAT repeat domain-containing protein n=1 Tax=Candidatus Uabimicrobium helgolandensis TaxID=3095367 RepID=UPI003558FC29